MYIIGTVGADGQMLMDCLAADKKPLDYLREADGVCGHAIIQLDSSGNNCIILFPGANHKMDQAYVDEMISKMDQGDIVLLQNEIIEVPTIIQQAHKAGLKVVIDPSPIKDEIGSYPLELVDIFIPNEIEGKSLTGVDDPDGILGVLSEKFQESAIILTLGEEGSIYKYKTEKYQQKAYESNIVDTTAAGDTYTG